MWGDLNALSAAERVADAIDRVCGDDFYVCTDPVVPGATTFEVLKLDADGVQRRYVVTVSEVVA